MATLQIQPATQNDIPHIRHIVDIAWPPTYGKILTSEQLDYMIDLIYSEKALNEQMSNGHSFFILWEDQTAMGFIDIEKFSDTACKLHKIYLLPASQGKGYGKELINYAMQQGRKMGGKHLKLNVNRQNKALGFYERMGFTIDEEVDIPIGKGYYMNDYVMVKQL